MRKFRILQDVTVVAALHAFACGDTETESNVRGPESPRSLGSIDRFEQVDMGVLPGSSFVPRSMGSRRETFIVKLAGDPVAVAQGNATTTLRSADRSALRNQLAVAQDAVAAQVTSLGGEVKARYRDAYNGLRIRIETSQLDALKRIPGVVAVYRPQLFVPNNTNGVPRIGGPGAWSPFAGVAGF